MWYYGFAPARGRLAPFYLGPVKLLNLPLECYDALVGVCILKDLGWGNGKRRWAEISCDLGVGPCLDILGVGPCLVILVDLVKVVDWLWYFDWFGDVFIYLYPCTYIFSMLRFYSALLMVCSFLFFYKLIWAGDREWWAWGTREIAWSL